MDAPMRRVADFVGATVLELDAWVDVVGEAAVLEVSVAVVAVVAGAAAVVVVVAAPPQAATANTKPSNRTERATARIVTDLLLPIMNPLDQSLMMLAFS
jgi:hypothetical protein